jgi:putative endonuclease
MRFAAVRLAYRIADRPRWRSAVHNRSAVHILIFLRLSPWPDRRDRHGMTQAKDAVGAYGERVAVSLLTGQGMVLLDRNWRCAAGELDIVLRDGAVVVFCEVKTRRTRRFGTPVEAVDPAKVRRLRRAAAQWLAASDEHPIDIRFDVVSVLPQRRGAARVDHLKDAF